MHAADAVSPDAVSQEGHRAQEVAQSPGAGHHESPTRPARHVRKSSKLVMGDPYCARPARCVGSNGKDEQ